LSPFPGYETVGWGPWLDTFHLYRYLFKHSRKLSLNGLINTLNLETDLQNLTQKFCPSRRQKYHCALFDALACALLLLYFVQLPQAQDKPFPWLLLHSSSGREGFEKINQICL
jgi:DNA polymerase-3 subunit epsilon